VAFLTGLFNVLLVLCSLFLICLVLIQRGKGGGLAGAFGGVGGSSAFGTKAGDVFTRVTIITAIIWFLLSMGLVVLANNRRSGISMEAPTSSSKEVPVSSTSGGKTTGRTSPAPAPAKSGESKPADTSGLPSVFDDEPPKTPGKPSSGGRAK
jgi:preprotein translocase subunit SecG